MKNMTGVILAGGAGTRLWPRSRAYWPKFLIKFGKLSLLGECYARLASFIPASGIFVVTNEEHKYAVKEDLLSVSPRWPVSNIIAEPAARNTLPAAVVAAAKALAVSGDDPMIICPSDHLIKNNRAFAAAAREAARAAGMGYIALFGVRPARPETGYGYIKPGARLFRGSKARAAAKFVEKPPVETAARVYKSGYLWNAGIFVVKPSVLAAEIRKGNPAFWALVSQIFNRAAAGAAPSDKEIAALYRRVPSVSIDYGLIEKSRRAAVVELDVPWDDLGDWNSLKRVYPRDSDGNVVAGNVVSVASRDCVIMGSKRLIGVVGIKNAVIVDTPDALLVAASSETQRVRELAAAISRREEALRHKVVSRPWGEYEVLESAPGYKVKIIRVLPGKKLSLQKHARRSENWLVVDGTARVVKGGSSRILGKGAMTDIPAFTVHRLENVSKKNLEVIEISRGKNISEDDIIRIEDDFGRK